MAAMKRELIDALFEEIKSPDDIFGQNGVLKQLQKAMVEKMLQAELTHHLGYEKNARRGAEAENARNGYGKKSVLTDSGSLELDVPRDRIGTFEPQVIEKRQTRLPGFDEKVISLYARGLSTREIQGHLHELYGTEVSPELISRVTETVMDEVHAWQQRPLAPVWPIVFLDALVVKIRGQSMVQNKAVYLALGVNMEGKKEVLGLWVAETEGAKFWLSVMTELRNRGVSDILVACCDGLKGFPDAIAAVFPQTIVQTCIVHMIRNSLRFVAYKDYKPITRDLRPIYQAATVEQAEKALSEFETVWGDKYPMIGRSWRANWDRVTPFFAFAPEIRKAIYTTNAIEAINRQIRKIIKTRGVFPTDESAIKLLWLALDRASQKWTMPIIGWARALQQFAIHFEGRLSL